MQIKWKIAIIIPLIILLIVGGIIMFRAVINNKQVYESDIYAYLPSDVTGILQISKEKQIDQTLSYFDELIPIIEATKASISYPAILVSYKDADYLVTKVTSFQEDEIKKILSDKIYPFFPPKEKTYRDATLLFYITDDNTFFICTFYKGIFIGGFNTPLIESYIDNSIDNNHGIADTPLGKKILNKVKTNNNVSLFLNNENSFSAFNIYFNQKQIEMQGYDTQINLYDWNCNQQIIDTLKVDYSIFPNDPLGYTIEMNNPLVSDSMQCLFSPPSYTFNIDQNMPSIHMLKCAEDKFKIYNKLNDMELGYINKKFDINDFHAGYRIYTTSVQMSKEVFGIQSPIYLTFYNDYMVFSSDKSALIYYLNNKGSFDNNRRLNNNKINRPLNSLIYSKDLRKWSPGFLNSKNPIINKNWKDIYISSIRENKQNTYNIFINN